MKLLPVVLLLLVAGSDLIADDMIMRSFGSYSFSGEDYDVLVVLKESTKGELVPSITFRSGQLTGITGIGKGASIPVKKGQWVVQFFPPHELWIFNGAQRIDLYERTIEPRGFKASSSTVAPKIRAKVPTAMKKLMGEQVTDQPNKPE